MNATIDFIDSVESFTIIEEYIAKAVKGYRAIGNVFGIIALIILAPISYLVAIFIFPILAIRFKGIYREGVKNIPTFSFEQVRSLENLFAKLSSISLLMVIHNRSNNRFVRILLWPINRSMSSISGTAELLRRLCQGQYLISKNELGFTEEEFAKHIDESKKLADIWDYETPEEDLKIIFDHKRSLCQTTR